MKWLRLAYKFWMSLIVVAIVVQIGAAGYGAFHDSNHLKDDGDVFTHKGFEDGWDFHTGLGWLIVYAILIALILALLARVGRPRIWFQLGLAVAGVLQVVFALAGEDQPRRRHPAPAERVRDPWSRGLDHGTRVGCDAHHARAGTSRLGSRHDPVARRRGRLGPGRVLRGRPPARLRPAGRGRHDRAAPDPLGPRPPGRRARPPEHQGGLARVREDRRAARVPVLRQRRARPRRHARGADPDLRRGDLRGRRADRPAARDPGRGAPRLVGRHRVRRLVQRPSRLPGDSVRSEHRASGGRRRRQCRARRRADARARAGGARSDRHHGPGDCRDQRLAPARDRAACTARAGPGRVHDAGAEGDGRARRRRRDRRCRRPRRRGRDGHELGAEPGGAAGVRGA